MTTINRLGAIDIGSNSVKLLICDMINHQGHIVSKKFTHTRMPLRLGDDTFTSGYISKNKKEKLAQLIKTFKSFLEISETENYCVCATSALREALNRQEIVDYVYINSGIKINVVSPSEEAGYIFLNIENQDPDILYIVVDVGGGSTEIVLSQNHVMTSSESFKLGTIRNLSQEEEQKEWLRLKKWLEERRINPRSTCLIGSGGNINKIISLLRRRKSITRSELKNYYMKLMNMDIEERVLKSNFGFNRAEVILPATKIYLNIMKILKIETIQIPVIGIADGIIKDIYLKKHVK